MDTQDEAHHVAVATPNSYGRFVKSFLVGPTTLGVHEIIGVQNSTEVHRSFMITSTQQVDDRTWGGLEDISEELASIEAIVDELESRLTAVRAEYLDLLPTISSGVAGIEGKLDDADTGLAAIKKEVAAIEEKLDAMASQGGALAMGPDKDAALLAAGYTQLYPATEYFDLTGNMNWESMNYLGPGARRDHTAVWTGSEMLVWGGWNGSTSLNTGGRYNPATDTWTAMSTTNGVGAPTARQGHTAVWTGSEMLVWGGYGSSGLLNTGGRYNPVTDTWTAMSTTNGDGAPTGRQSHTAVWTGSEMLVWGGSSGPAFPNTGGRYNPVTDTWTAMSTSGAPEAREFHTAVWTGSEMLVWGGYNGTYFNTGGRYDPVTNTWTAMSTTKGDGAPEARYRHTAVWTGSEMLVWGGYSGIAYLNTGKRYNPVTDTWTVMSTTDAPQARYRHTAVWTGSEMLVWGGYGSSGYINTGGRYNPVTDTWTTMSTTDAPQARYDHTAIWTGSEMLVWGGYSGTAYLNTGGCLQLEHYYYYVK
jgi:N-acetylneuraminic acid mutarotase